MKEVRVETGLQINWWLERFGRFGRHLHDLAYESMRTAHEEHADAQSIISAPHRRVYGSVNYSAQYLFNTSLKDHPDVSFLPPKRGATKLPVVNGRVIVLWRYANRDGMDLFLQKFATSGSRAATFEMSRQPSQPSLGAEVDIDMNLTDSDKEFLATLASAADGASDLGTYYPVVLVAYASNASGIYQAVGADASLKDDGTLNLTNLEYMKGIRHNEPKLRAASVSKRFDLAPRKPLVLKSKIENEE